MAKQKLTTKQQRFVDFYDGNATDAARKAGYKGNANTLGQTGDENLKKPKIAIAIASREKKRNGNHIASREERQQFWTRGMNFDVRKLLDEHGAPLNIKDLDDETAKMVQGIKITVSLAGDKKVEYKLVDRNKSSENLGRSEADFTDNINNKQKIPGLAEAIKEIAKSSGVIPSRDR